MAKDLFTANSTVAFSTGIRLPYGSNFRVISAPMQEHGKWVAAAQTDRMAFKVELESDRLPSTNFIVLRSYTDDGEHYKCFAIPPEVLEEESAEIERELLSR